MHGASFNVIIQLPGRICEGKIAVSHRRKSCAGGHLFLRGHSPKKDRNFASELKSVMNIHGLSDKNSVLLKLYKFGVKVFGIFVNYLYFPKNTEPDTAIIM